MRNRSLSLVCATSLLCLASLAHADEGWYVSGQAGASILTSSELDDPTGILAALGTEINFDVGYGLSGALGYHWGLFRVEGEITYAESDIDEVEVVGIGFSGSGDVSSLGFMANAFKDFEIGDGWQFNIGGGIGYAIVSINDASVGGVPLADDDDWVFAYQLGTGIGYQMSPTTTLSLDYRYFATVDPEFNDVDGIPFEAEYDSHVIRIGVRFNF